MRKIIAIGALTAARFMFCDEVVPFDKGHLSLVSENDSFIPYLDTTCGFPDRYYTAGNSIVYHSNEMNLRCAEGCSGTNFLAIMDPMYHVKRDRVTSYSLYVSQKIYTPRFNNSAFNAKERPYAAMLYMGMGVYHRFENAKEYIRVDVGILGKEALGEEIQSGFHKMIGVGIFRGWHHQIGSAAVVNINYSYLHRLYLAKGPISSDVIAVSQVNASTVSPNAQASVGLRVGHNLDSMFKPSKITYGDYEFSHSKAPFMYVYVMVTGEGVVYNRLITGMKPGYNDLEPTRFNQNLEWGVIGGNGKFSISTSFNYRSREYKGQVRRNDFGSVSVSISM